MSNYNCVCPSPYVGCRPIDSPNLCERCGGLVAERSEVVSAPEHICSGCPNALDDCYPRKNQCDIKPMSVDGGARPDPKIVVKGKLNCPCGSVHVDLDQFQGTEGGAMSRAQDARTPSREADNELQ
jgi:hypothetical protein